LAVGGNAFAGQHAEFVASGQCRCRDDLLATFAKGEKPWVEALCDIIADNAAVLAEGKDSTFQNKVHLAMTAKGFGNGTQPSGSN
jgi:hypothetical protein